MTWIRARFASSCKECGNEIETGELMVYPPGMCEECGDLADEPDKPRQGGPVSLKPKPVALDPKAPKCADCWHHISQHDSSGCRVCSCMRTKFDGVTA